MIVTRPDGVAQGGKPCPLDQACVDRELRARDAAAVESVHVLRIRLEFLLFESFGASGQFFDSLLDLRVRGARGAANEAIVGVVPGVHGSGVVEVVDEHRGEQVVDRERIVGMLLDDLLELLRRAVVVHVVETVKGSIGLRIVRSPVSAARCCVRLA